MSRSHFMSFLLRLLVTASTAYARFGSQMHKSGIPSSMKELLKPVLNTNGYCGETVMYHDLTRTLIYYSHKRTDVESPVDLQMFKGKDGKTIMYHDLTRTLIYYSHKRADVEIPVDLQMFKGNISFFIEKDLFSGNPLKVMLDSTGVLPECAYLPRRVAESLPFSTADYDQILSQFSIEPNSADATTVKETLELCEWRTLRGEEKTCITSLEEMEELAVAKLGKGAKPFTTKMVADSAVTPTYEVKQVELKGDNYMSCHRLSYPYAVHYCHKMHATVVYKLQLVRDDGVADEAMAICHRDNSDWDEKFFAFKRLHLKPGQEVICHLYPKGHILWMNTNDEVIIKQVV